MVFIATLGAGIGARITRGLGDGGATGALSLRGKRTLAFGASGTAGTTRRLLAPSIWDTTAAGKAATTCATTGCAAATMGAATASPTFGPNSNAITKAPAA